MGASSLYTDGAHGEGPVRHTLSKRREEYFPRAFSPHYDHPHAN